MIVLLVDKELGIREVGRQVLKQAGFQVESTGNGTKALKMFRSRNYSLVITDLLHPGLNEAELIVKSLDVNPCQPVLLLTASPIPTIVKPCLLTHLLEGIPPFSFHLADGIMSRLRKLQFVCADRC
jgi:DNA-binding NtrC family response regulator